MVIIYTYTLTIFFQSTCCQRQPETLNLNNGNIFIKVPSRVYIPHVPVSSAYEEVVCKMSVNGRDWLTVGVFTPAQPLVENRV